MASNYSVPLDIASLFKTQNDVADFIEYVVTELERAIADNQKEMDYIPPIIYNQQGRVFNIDYNFMIYCLSLWSGSEAIEGDFSMSVSSSPDVIRNGLFLVASLFDGYYDVVRIKQKTIDPSRYKSVKSLNLTGKFYNALIMNYGENVRRFSAVPFSESEVKRLISEKSFEVLKRISSNESYVQMAFGIGKCMEFVRLNESDPKPVFE